MLTFIIPTQTILDVSSPLVSNFLVITEVFLSSERNKPAEE